ncbi:Blue-light-activated histidine kinase (plasmid) [Sulfitobacter indolifex]|uniref:MASE1 domain-containing protein n=2 Tax=Sulfitobacter indolifex TaxID=225422 RepID=UPI0002E846F7|nr:MASE1 domain-containing protein [Sulfitobacter indolifex]UOA20572.1 Blue-light-activated histidine kinase [Sulfitobacter indolifex]UOA20859.1 Blue-light-activated histidine kinase [Sulfitobacter indolifex]
MKGTFFARTLSSGALANLDAGFAQSPDKAARRGAHFPSIPSVLGFYAIYLLAAAFGRWMAIVPGAPVTVWPPNGVILAALLIHRRETWPWWIALGIFGEITGNFLWYNSTVTAALGYMVANAAAIFAAGYILAPLFDAPIRRLTTLSQVLGLLVIGVLLSPMISATIGSAFVASEGKSSFADTWPLWWLGDATGTLIATPMTITVVNAWRDGMRLQGRALLEGFVIAGLLVGVTAWDLATGSYYTYLLPLPVLWAALRFEFRGAALAVVGLTFVIGAHGHILGASDSPALSIALMHNRMQFLILTAASIGLIVAAIVRQQKQALLDLAQINAELESRVKERTKDIEMSQKRFEATFKNAGVGISIVSGEGALMRVNDRLAEMLGYSAEEVEGRLLDDFTHPEDIPRGRTALEALKSGAADEYDLEKRYLCKDGSLVWGHTTVSCVRDAKGRISYLIKIIQDITDRKELDENRQMLMREVNHRGKNLLSVVKVIARQTALRSPENFIEAFGERLQALAANQDILVNNGWQQIELDALVRGQLEHFEAIRERVTVVGPPVKVSAHAAQAIGMAMHELATNAAKYGSLSNDVGRVVIDWSVEDGNFSMSWCEQDGPAVSAPTSRGFGTTVIDKLTASSLSADVELTYAPTGLVWKVSCQLATLRDD